MFLTGFHRESLINSVYCSSSSSSCFGSCCFCFVFQQLVLCAIPPRISASPLGAVSRCGDSCPWTSARDVTGVTDGYCRQMCNRKRTTGNKLTPFTARPKTISHLKQRPGDAWNAYACICLYMLVVSADCRQKTVLLTSSPFIVSLSRNENRANRYVSGCLTRSEAYQIFSNCVLGSVTAAQHPEQSVLGRHGYAAVPQHTRESPKAKGWNKLNQNLNLSLFSQFPILAWGCEKFESEVLPSKCGNIVRLPRNLE